MNSGIYTITSLVDNKILVGQSISIKNRISQHKHALKNNLHDNKHLQSAYNKYGHKNFVFEILILCNEQYLFSEEHYWCNMLNTHDPKFGYNIKPTNPNGCYRHSFETKLKIGKANKGKKHSLEFKENCSIRAKNRTYSKETLEKLRISSTGRKHSDLSKQKISASKKGKKLNITEEWASARSNGFKNWLNLGLKNKRIINEKTGKIYNSVTECINDLKISTSAFYRNIKGKGNFKNKYKLSYEKTIGLCTGIS